MDNIVLASDIRVALTSWDLDKVQILLTGDNAYLLSDAEYARLLDDLYDRREANRLLNDLDNHIENKKYAAVLQAREDLQSFGQEYGHWVNSHPSYDRVMQRFNVYQTEHLEQEAQTWLVEINRLLQEDEGDINAASKRLAIVNVFLQKMASLPNDVRTKYEQQARKQWQAYKSMKLASDYIDDIERANAADFFSQAQELIRKAQADGVLEKKLKDLWDEVERNQMRSEGESVTMFNDPNKSDLERLVGASFSATKAGSWRLAYNLASHGYYDKNIEELEEKSFEYRDYYFEHLLEKIAKEIASERKWFELGEYEKTKRALNWTKKLGTSPGKFEGKVDDAMNALLGQEPLKTDWLNETQKLAERIIGWLLASGAKEDQIEQRKKALSQIKSGQELLQQIAELEQRIDDGIKNRQEASKSYAKAESKASSETLTDISQAIALLLNALETDSRYKAAQILLKDLAEQYSVLIKNTFETQLARTDDALNIGAFSRAERYLEKIQTIAIQAEQFATASQVIKISLTALDLSQYVQEINARQKTLNNLRRNETTANEKKEEALQIFNAARNNLNDVQRDKINNLLNEWEALTQRKVEVKRMRRLITEFWEQDYAWLTDSVAKLQDATQKGDWDVLQAFEALAAEVEGRGHGFLKAELALAEYYSKMGGLKRKDDVFAAVEYYVKAEEHAKLAGNDVGAATHRQAIEKLQVNLKDERRIIEARKTLKQALEDNLYEQVQDILADMSDEIKGDAEIKRLSAAAKNALAQFHHDQHLKKCRVILSVPPEDGALVALVSPKDRDFTEARDLAAKALDYIATSPEAINLRDTAIAYEHKENEQVDEIDKYIKVKNFSAATELAQRLKREGYLYFGAKLWNKWAEAENEFAAWNNNNNNDWELAKRGARALVDNLVRIEDAETMFIQARTLLEKCVSVGWRPSGSEKEGSIESAVENIINEPWRALNVIVSMRIQAKNLLMRGNVTSAYEALNGTSVVAPKLIRRDTEALFAHMGALNKILVALRDELDKAQQDISLIMGEKHRTENKSASGLRAKNGIDYELISNVSNNMKKTREIAGDFETALAGHEDTKVLLVGKEDSTGALLFRSTGLKNLYRTEEEKFKYLTGLEEWLGTVEKKLHEYKFAETIDELDQHELSCPSALANLREAFKIFSGWLDERKQVYKQINIAKKMMTHHWLFPPFLEDKRIAQALEILGKLDGTFKSDDSFTVQGVSAQPDHVIMATAFEKRTVRDLREYIQQQHDAIFSRTLGYFFKVLALLSALSAIVFLATITVERVAQVLAPTPTATSIATNTPNKPSVTMTLPPPTMTFVPTALPSIMGETMGNMYIRRFPSTSAETVPPGSFMPGATVQIIRYCDDSWSETWVAVDLGGYYGWLKLYEGSAPRIAIGENRTDPKRRLSPAYRVNCPLDRYSPIEGVPTPDCGAWDCDYTQ